MSLPEKPLCARCVMPASPPWITFDGAGVCNLCRLHEQGRAEAAARPPLETDFVKLLKKNPGKDRYDALVMCSGGKDSTSALYYMVRRYKRRVLAFMFDHGFETEEAQANVRRAVEILGVDYLQYRSTFMHGMFDRILTSGSQAVLCHLCSIWYMDTTFEIAARYQIPIIIAGWTKGQSTDGSLMSKCACTISAPEFQGMGQATHAFLDSLKGDPVYGDFPRSMEEVLKRAKKRFKSTVLSPHWFLPTDTETYVALIERELGWKVPEFSYPRGSTNCALNFVSVQKSMEHFGFTHYHVELSKLIRQGLVTRQEALRQLEIHWDAKVLNGILAPLTYRFPE
ncbi:MAG: 7-cyano-7-deazaguanine synthase [Pseudomonadota bacterium]